MLTWSIIFLVAALVTGVVGFTGVASTSNGIARVMFFIFLMLFAVSMLTSRGFSV